MMIYFVYLLISWISTRYIFSLLSRKWRSLPPGPIPLPIIGNLLSIRKNPHSSLSRLSKTHGPVMWLQLGSLNTVVISSPSAAKEMMRGKNDVAFSYRTMPDAAEPYFSSIVWLPPHDEWRNLRKIATNLIFSSSSLDARLHLRNEKIQQLLTEVDACRRSGVAIDIGQAGFNTGLNLMSNTIFSVDLADQKLGSSDRSGFKETFRQLLLETGKPNLSDYFPLLKRFDIR